MKIANGNKQFRDLVPGDVFLHDSDEEHEYVACRVIAVTPIGPVGRFVRVTYAIDWSWNNCDEYTQDFRRYDGVTVLVVRDEAKDRAIDLLIQRGLASPAAYDMPLDEVVRQIVEVNAL